MPKPKKHLKPIHYKTIPHKSHRYETVGDYWENAKDLQVRVSQLSDWRREFLVLVHELVEIHLLQHRGLPLVETDKFDIMFEKERAQGKHPIEAEPGDDIRCPYRTEHRIAENIERQLAIALGVDWNNYEDEVMHL